jgi:transcriptional regulator with XRE-family HTH domain
MNWIDNLKKAMDDKNVNIEKLKTRIEEKGGTITRNTISNILHGRNQPKIDTVEMIAAALEIEVWQLFTSSFGAGPDSELNGYVEFNGEVHRVKSKQDLEKLLSMLST